jgi:hypothetical protein
LNEYSERVEVVYGKPEEAEDMLETSIAMQRFLPPGRATELLQRKGEKLNPKTVLARLMVQAETVAECVVSSGQEPSALWETADYLNELDADIMKLDNFTEFANGNYVPTPNGLLGALNSCAHRVVLYRLTQHLLHFEQFLVAVGGIKYESCTLVTRLALEKPGQGTPNLLGRSSRTRRRDPSLVRW